MSDGRKWQKNLSSAIGLIAIVLHPLHKPPDANGFILEFTGGLRAWRQNKHHWMLCPLLRDYEPVAIGPIKFNELHRIASSARARPIGFLAFSTDNGTHHESWKSITPGEKNHFSCAADKWRQASSNITRDRTQNFFASLSPDTTHEEISHVLDSRRRDEDLAECISLSLRNMDVCIREVADHYHTRLIQLLRDKQFDVMVATSTDIRLYSTVQAFFVHLGAARDFLAELIAFRCGIQFSSNPSMAWLVNKLRSSRMPSDSLIDQLKKKGLIVERAGGTKLELGGWLAEVTTARKEFVHKRTYGSRFVEQSGRVVKANLALGAYRFERAIVLPDGTQIDLLEFLAHHLQECSRLFLDCAKASGYDTSIPSITDDDIISGT